MFRRVDAQAIIQGLGTSVVSHALSGHWPTDLIMFAVSKCGLNAIFAGTQREILLVVR